MTARQIITKADALRPNRLSDDQKARYVFQCDTDFAETIGTEPLDPTELDTEMQMPYPHDEAYVLYLAAMIDFAQQDTDLYANDMTMANKAIADAKAWWRRNNVPRPSPNIRTM